MVTPSIESLLQEFATKCASLIPYTDVCTAEWENVSSGAMAAEMRDAVTSVIGAIAEGDDERVRLLCYDIGTAAAILYGQHNLDG